MSLSITRAVRRGAARFLSRAGLLLTAVYAALFAVYQLSFNGVLADLLPTVLPVEGSELAVATYPAPTVVYVAVVAASLLAVTALTVVAVRTFVAGRTGTVPRAFYTRRMGRATANLLLGGLVYGILVLLGTVLLVIPGIVAYVGLIFYTMYVAVEDENLVAALRESWRLVRPDFLRVLVLVLALVGGVAVLGGGIGAVAGAGVAAAGLGGWSGVVSGVVTAPLTLFLLAVLSAAFTQLREERGGGLGGGAQQNDGPIDDAALSG